MPALSLQAAFLWATSPALLLLCAFLLYRRKLLPQFKFFASFLVFLALKAGLLFLCYRFQAPGSWAYYSAYWVTNAMADMFVIAVLYELFCAAFKPFAGLQDLVKVAFKWAAGSILFIGVLVFATNPTTQGAHWLTECVNNFKRVVEVMECAVLMFLFIGSQHLGMQKRNRVFGIALGFGIQAFCELLVFSAAVNSHISKLRSWYELVPVIYYFTLLIWVGYLAQPEPSRVSLHIPVTSPLLRWNEVALALGHSGGQVALMNPEPFMPQVERMVEQVMQREIVERRHSRVV